MGKERDVVRPYVVDGIKEYDNPMPSWWLILFYATIVFAGIYLVVVEVMDQYTLEKELRDDRGAYAAVMAEQEQQRQAEGGSLEEKFKDEAMIAAGKDIYMVNCSPCHGTEGQGLVGPNLTDNYWIHGGAPADIVKTVIDGVPAKGMIAWKPILGVEKVEQVSAYVYSLIGTEPPNPKAPEGEPVDGSSQD